MPNRELLDFADYPQIAAAGIGDFYVMPDGRARIVWFDWFRVDGVFRRKIVGTLTREAVSLRIATHELAVKMQASGGQ